MVESAFMEMPFEPAIAGFFCEKCSHGCLKSMGQHPVDFPPHLKSMRILCAEKVKPEMIRQALQGGADGVLICGCLIGKCRSARKNPQVLTRIHREKMTLAQLGLPQARLRHEWIAVPEVDDVRKMVEDFAEQIRSLGPVSVY